MLCYHGTTADNLQNILENGLLCHTDKLWCVSNNEIYFWGKNYVEKELQYGEDVGYTEENQEDFRDNLISQAFQSASCGLASAKDCRAIIVVFDIPEDDHETDFSCENMETANCVSRDIQPHEIREILISSDLGLVRGYFINLMLQMPLCNQQFSILEEKVAKVFDSQYLLDEIDGLLDWQVVNPLCVST